MTSPLAPIRHLLIDLDGVLYRGNTAISGADAFIAWLRSRGIVFQLVTNNATLTPTQYVEKLAHMGIRIAPDDVFTSALATARYLGEQGGGTAYVVGQDGLLAALAEVGISIADGQPDWVVVGLDRTLTYDKLAAAALAIERGARFVGSNPDTSFPTERGLEPGAGAILAAISATTGKRPTVIGKPEPLMLQLAMERVGGSKADTAMLGDRLDTDIAAANALGIPSILVLTGVSHRDELADSPYRPTVVVDDLAQLEQTWQPAIAPKG